MKRHLSLGRHCPPKGDLLLDDLRLLWLGHVSVCALPSLPPVVYLTGTQLH